ncbi:hypothetical protein A2973_03160 [Candidatus Gottesmanbacteria bacterium RIFCSPLOWO2_01_FULL_49_10]|uniref:Uncharacterized protein n=1 Tax=Candidatus Gottesmanbacteria bacterium RIFCSPLOWO2_01_FULL_49_10 TaxID=1798396 RepID=A0A1F6B128_9BACT|nr:MAG: hypothetical protein A2973_03160 [Candidatus Gottesmanbacteria bacterium RIFCSPLOWO2_01_FULL_49_10]
MADSNLGGSAPPAEFLSGSTSQKSARSNARSIHDPNMVRRALKYYLHEALPTSGRASRTNAGQGYNKSGGGISGLPRRLQDVLKVKKLR